MQKQIEDLSKKAEYLFNQKKYGEVIKLLTDEVLEAENNSMLFAWRARSHGALQEFEKSLIFASKAICIDGSNSMALHTRGNFWFHKKEYDKAFDDYSTVIKLDEKYAIAYNNRGLIWAIRNEQDKAIEDYDRAIKLNEKYADAYSNRGLAFSNKNEFDKSIEDYTKAITLGANTEDNYNNRGVVWYDKKKYDKAIEDYDKAIELNEKYGLAYFNRGLVWQERNEFKKALKDYSKAIKLDKLYEDSFLARATVYTSISKFKNAIEDYKIYISLKNNPEDYWSKIAQSRITELEKKISDKVYNAIVECINNVKELLVFQNISITHYTSLSAATFMILDKSKFRLSEASFLNDTSEGRELFEFLKFSISEKKDDTTVAEKFIEKPFIGSFVAGTKNDDLTLWRMYGKEVKAEATGCALTINKDDFLTAIKQHVSNKDKTLGAKLEIEGQFTFYNIAYITKNKSKFIIPENIENQQKLNDLMFQLKAKVQKLSDEQRINVAKPLNGIAYLFKTIDYQHENEVRLIVHGTGFNEEIKIQAMPPKVYVELIEITNALSKITLGPKVEKADEWAATFNYQLKADKKQREIEIEISHLPFK